MTAEQVLAFAEVKGVEYVDLRFVDLVGRWGHVTVPIRELTADLFVNGFGVDGSEMVVVPVGETVAVDPFCQHPTMGLICDVKDARTGAEWGRDPRWVARKAEAYMRGTGVADTALFGPKLEFFIFDRVLYDQGVNYARYEVDGREGVWRRGGAEPDNLGNQVRAGEGEFAVPPADTMHNLRAEMVAALEECGIEVEGHHHGVATGGQARIDMRSAPLVEMGDKVMTCKYVVRNAAARHGKVVTFMPKPLYGDRGSGMGTQLSMRKGETALFYEEGKYAELSDAGRWAIGGLIRHAGAVLSFTNATTNSYRRLGPGCEGPVGLIWSRRNGSGFVRVPTRERGAKMKRIELCWPDASGNPYLAFSAVVMAALDGIQNRVDPGEPIDRDLGELSEAERAEIKCVPASLEAALAALERDHEFLLKGDVFTEDVVRHWIKYKMENEVDALRSRPHPYEFCLYFDL